MLVVQLKVQPIEASLTSHNGSKTGVETDVFSRLCVTDRVALTYSRANFGFEFKKSSVSNMVTHEMGGDTIDNYYADMRTV